MKILDIVITIGLFKDFLNTSITPLCVIQFTIGYWVSIKRSITVANIAEQEWFCRYPWPTQVTFDRGSEFIGKDFQRMIKEDYGIKARPITIRNPQANAIVERIHQVIGNIIRTFELEDNYLDEDDPWTFYPKVQILLLWVGAIHIS